MKLRILLSMGIVCLSICGCRQIAKGLVSGADEAVEIGVRNADNVVVYADDVVEETIEIEGRNVLKTGDDGAYYLNNRRYNSFDDLPIGSTDNIYYDGEITPGQAAKFMEKEIKFVYNNASYEEQKELRFEIVFLTSNDAGTVRELYDVDVKNAEVLIEMASALQDNNYILKAESYQKMLDMQDDILRRGKVPILIFHNSTKRPLGDLALDSKTNIITCNSFEVQAKSYLTSTDLLDMRAIIESVSQSYDSVNLENFYTRFTEHYYAHMKTKHQQQVLICLGGGAGVTGGVGAIAYYNSNKKKI